METTRAVAAEVVAGPLALVQLSGHLGNRHGALAMLLTLCLLGQGAALAQGAAQKYPQKPVRMLIPNAPGSSTDIVGRLIGSRLSEGWGQPVLVDNRAGATGVVAAEALARAAPDGHTMYLVAFTQLIGTLMYQRYMLPSEFASVSMVGTTPFALAVSSSLPVKSVAEWIAYAKARPGQLMYGSSGQWGGSHLCMEVFNEMTGLKLTHVPHPTIPAAMTGLMGDQIQVLCPAAPAGAAYAQGGRIRMLGITYQRPTRLVPGVPPISDTVPGYELLGWYGMQVTLKTPEDVVNRINADLGRVLRTTEVQEKMNGAGVEAATSTPAEFAGFLKREGERWGRILKEGGAKPEP